MQQVLYRKYRSQNFAELLGQDQITQVLKQSVLEGRIAHAYLFTGPRGTGKTSAARILAKAINCLDSKQGEPCNKCRNCIAINENKFLDLLEIDAASNRGIDEIRQLKERVGFLPAEGKFKIYIVDEVHMMTTEAFNALLKTLEEPPPQVVFILATTEAHKLPLTILSRTQRFDFRLGSNEEILSKVKRILDAEEITMDDRAKQLVTDSGQWSYRDTETILEKVLSAHAYDKKAEITGVMVEKMLGLTSSELVRTIFTESCAGNYEAALAALREAEVAGVNHLQLAKQLLEYARIELLLSVENKPVKFSLNRITEFIKEVTLASAELKSALVQSLPLEIAVIKLAGQLPTQNLAPQVNSPKNTAIDTENENVKNLPKVKIDAVPQKTKIKSAGIDLQKVNEGWKDILREAKGFNHQMVAFLSGAKVKGSDGNMLVIEVPFDFHKKRLEAKRSQDVFNQITLKLFATEMGLICEVNKNLAPTNHTQNSNSSLVEDVFSDML